MPKRMAVCIGVNKHIYNPQLDLRYACSDAEDISSLLTDKERGNFDYVSTLFDEDATKDNILALFKDLLLDADLAQDDLALIYFAGHGAIDKADKLCLIPHDVEYSKNRSIDIDTTLHISDLEKYLENTSAGTVVIILDACHSGGAGKLLGHLKYDDSSTRIFVGGARFSEPAWETPEFERGRFTQCLLEAINQKPTIGEWITLQQCLAFAQTEMAKIDTEQIIEVSSHSIDQSILLFRNPLYTLISKDFIDQVKHLCEITNCTIIPVQSDQEFPNVFVIREQRSFGRYDDTLVMCLNNLMVNITIEDITQLNLLFESLQRVRQITNGILITQNELPAFLNQKLHQFIARRTVTDILRNLINFDRYIQQLIVEFEKGDPEKAGSPALKACYVELYAEVANERKPIMKITSTWLHSEDKTKAIILGGFGTGKTTCARKFAYELAKLYASSPDKRDARIPLLFPLRRLPKFSNTDMEAFIIAYLKQNCKVSNPDFGAFQAMNDAGMFVLIFDGFDEMVVRADEDVIKGNFVDITRLATTSKSKVLITSRPEAFLSQKEENEILSMHIGYSDPSQNPLPFERITLLPFTSAQIDLYLQRRVSLIASEVDAEKDWKIYRTQIDKILGLRELAERPVLLEITINALPKLIEEGGVVTRSRLYETYLLNEMSRQKIKRDFLIQNKEQRLVLIQIIAKFLYSEARTGLTEEQIRELLKPEFTTSQHDDLEAYVRDFIACSFMVRDVNQYRFSHRSFVEYLVARVIASEINTGKYDFIKQLKLTKSVSNWLLELKPEPDKSWRNTLWMWIKRTYDKNVETVGYVGGNAITLLSLMGEKLSGVDLGRTILRGAVLVKYDCSKTNFVSCDLKEADFEESNLEDANFSNSILNQANFNQANLTRATLISAQLSSSVLTHANLSNADFSLADLRNTKMWLAIFDDSIYEGNVLKGFIQSNPNFKDTDLTDVKFERSRKGGCFLAGTKVKMGDGSEKQIEEITVGDTVISYCPETRSFVNNKVVQLFIGETDSLVTINDHLTTTPSETIYTGEKWLTVGNLKRGDCVLGINGMVTIFSVKHLQATCQIYGLIVTPDHNFIVDGMVVHNGKIRFWA